MKLTTFDECDDSPQKADEVELCSEDNAVEFIMATMATLISTRKQYMIKNAANAITIKTVWAEGNSEIQ